LKNILEDLSEWKEQINEAKSRRSELQGSIKEILARMKKEYSVDSIESTKKKILKLSKESEKIQKVIEKEYEELKEMMEGIDE